MKLWPFWKRIEPVKPAEPVAVESASSKGVQADVFDHERRWGSPIADWMPSAYADYYFISTPIYAAIRMRANAMTRVPLRVGRQVSQTQFQPVDPDHPLQRRLDNPNPDFTLPELLAALEVQRCVWGSAALSNEFNPESEETELWPLRPDHLIPLPGNRRRHRSGYIYRGDADEVTYTPDEVTEFRAFNPQQMYAGASPLAGLRLTADTAREGLLWNRDIFRRGGVPDFGVTADEIVTGTEIDAFYERWEKRYAGSAKVTRPVIIPGGKAFFPLGTNARDMDYFNLLAWYVEETARTFGVPQPYLASLREATLANVASLDEIFWTITMIPECEVFATKMTRDLFPKLGYFNLVAKFDYSFISALREDENLRRQREESYLDRGVMSIEEVREGRGMSPKPEGTLARPAQSRSGLSDPSETETNATRT